MNGRELKMLTKPELEAIRERVEKATKGPYKIGTEDGFVNGFVNPNGRLVAFPDWCGCCTASVEFQREEDRTFFEHSQPDVMALLQHIELLSRLLRTAQHSLVALDGFVATDRPDLVHMPEDLSMKINNGVEVLAINRVLGDSYPETFTQDELLQLGREE